VVLVSPALFATAMAVARAKLSFRRPRIVVWVQDLYSLGVTETNTGGGAVVWFMKLVESTTLRAADDVVVIHDRFAAFVTKSLGVDSERVTVVRNWTHLPVLPPTDPSAIRKIHGWPSETTVVLHAGNMGNKQGLENVVNAARLADAQQLPLLFVLLGDGNQRSALEALATDVTRLQFVDPIGDDTFQSTLAAADILLVNERTGVSEMSVPSKLTSYFNSGRPVVAATDPFGATAGEINAASGGLVVQSGAPQILVNACLELRQNPRRSAQLGSNGLEYRKHNLSEDASINRYAALIYG